MTYIHAVYEYECIASLKMADFLVKMQKKGGIKEYNEKVVSCGWILVNKHHILNSYHEYISSN